MSLELCVYIDRARTPSVAQLQEAIDRLGFQVRPNPKWAVDDEVLACTFLEEEDVTLQYGVADEWEADEAPVAATLGTRDRVFYFWWGSSPWDFCCVMAVAAALVAEFDAVVYDPDEQRVVPLEELQEMYADTLDEC